jgi:mannose-1-phosphate guanylyltransferase/mannose-6-phosphate isomerase
MHDSTQTAQTAQLAQSFFTDVIIMAGGSGTRLWPASTTLRPKQFLKAPGLENPEGSTFFGMAVERALAVTADCKDSKIIIVAGKSHTDLIAGVCSALNAQARDKLLLLPEPRAKNTGAAIAAALAYINLTQAGTERTILVLTSDHIIGPLDIFKADAAAAAYSAKQAKLTVFGITPARPETGYGYIEAGAPENVPEDVSQLSYSNFSCRLSYRSEVYSSEVYNVTSFREKPDKQTAQQFVDSKKFYWNSGMFAFSAKFLTEEFKRSAPAVLAPFEKLQTPNEKSYSSNKGLQVLDQWDGLDLAYEQAQAISFDYAIAEKCRQRAMVKAGFSWTDVGSWDEYSRLAESSSAEVFIAGESGSLKPSANNFEANEAASGGTGSCFVDSDIPVALCGVEDLIVIIRTGKDGAPAAALVSKKGSTQQVKEIVEKIKTAGRTELL